jgi:integrase
MAAQKFENNRRNGSAAPHDPSPEAAASEHEPAEPTAANRAIGPAPDPAAGSARLPGRLQNLAETARDYAKASSAENTRKAYGSDWRHFSGWARRHGLPALPPDPQILGLYVAACASGAMTGKSDSVATLERRISALRWNFAQRGEKFDRADRHVATVLAGVRRTQGRPPEQKEAILPEDLKAMIATLDLGDLRGLRDRAILLIGFAGGLRRSEIVGLDCGARQTRDGTGWTEILGEGILVTLRGKTGWREVEIGRGSSDLSCPVVALEAWLKFARIEHGPLFRRVIGKTVDSERLADKHVARLVKRTAMAAGVRGDLVEGERARKFSGHSLRAGLASAAEVDERFVQKQLGHASAEMTRRYQRRRDRFRVNLTKAAGL